MKIFINGEIRDIPEVINLFELLAHLSLPQQRIAVELNESVVRRKDWHITKINDTDKIEIIHFVGGG
jgi:sulfur carrier protein